MIAPKLLGVSLLFFLAGIAGGNDWQVLSRVYSLQSLASWEAGDAENAQKLAQEALGFWENNGEALWIMGLSSLKQNQVLGSLKWLEEAVERGEFSSVNPSQPVVDLARVLMRLKDYPRVITLLTASSFLPYSQDVQILLAKAYFHSGQRASFLKVLKQGLGLNTDTSRLLPVMLWDFPSFPELASLLKKYKAENKGPTEAEISQALLHHRHNPASLKAVMTLLKGSGYQTPLMQELLFLQGELSQNDLASQYSQGGSSGFYTVFKDVALRWTPDLVFFANLDKTFYFDNDADGYPDGGVTLEKGQLKSWSADLDQDGQDERVFEYEGGQLVSVREISPEFEITLHYEEYPYLDRLEIVDKGLKSSLLFSPYQVAYPLFDPVLFQNLPSLFYPHLFAQKWNTVDVKFLRSQAARLEKYGENGRLFQRWWLYEGQAYRMEEDSFRQSRLTTVYFFNKGVLNRVYRDLDGDGIMEILERHKDGQRYLVLADINGNRKAEYFWMMGPPSMELWDFTEKSVAGHRIFHLDQGKPIEIVTLQKDSAFLQLPEWENLPWP